MYHVSCSRIASSSIPIISVTLCIISIQGKHFGNTETTVSVPSILFPVCVQNSAIFSFFFNQNCGGWGSWKPCSPWISEMVLDQYVFYSFERTCRELWFVWEPGGGGDESTSRDRYLQSILTLLQTFQRKLKEKAWWQAGLLLRSSSAGTHSNNNHTAVGTVRPHNYVPLFT
jgi:hypothetical protein